MPLTISLPTPEIWVAATLIGIAALSALIFWATTPWQSKERSDAPWTLRALNTFGLILALPWALLICATFVGLWNTLLHSPIAHSAIDARWNALAIVGHITALLALVSAPLALIRVYTTERQTRTAEQGHMTDRISKAVEQLGAEKTVKAYSMDNDQKPVQAERTKPNIEVRIGGLLSLERISQDSVKYDKGRDHVRVMEIICAYVRENAKKESDQSFADFADIPAPRIDIQTAINILGRRGDAQLRIERSDRYRLNLRSCDLCKIDFTKANLAGGALSYCRLDGATFDQADLTGTYLAWCSIHFVSFRTAKMVGTHFEGSNFGDSWFGTSIFAQRTAHSIFIQGADFSKAQRLGGKFKDNCSFGTKNTLLPSANEKVKDRAFNAIEDAFLQDENLHPRFDKSSEFAGFQYWSPYASNDFANFEFENRFRVDKGLVGWPHVDTET